jgi:hypothetical protein
LTQSFSRKLENLLENLIATERGNFSKHRDGCAHDRPFLVILVIFDL